jgi:putative transposase
MKRDTNHRAPRRPNYDYSQIGRYFVTICTQHRHHLLGAVNDGRMIDTPAGEMVAEYWRILPEKFPNIRLDAFILMPNHLHGILIIEKSGVVSIPDVMRWFKTMTTNAYIRGVKVDGWPAFQGKLWQRSYHDHIIRDDASLTRIRQYIHNNPANWHDDSLR